MKRPFACIGLSMLFSLVFAIAVHTAAIQAAVVCFVLAAVLFAFKAFGKKNTLSAAVCCLSACVAIFGYCGVVKYYVEPLINRYDGRTVEFSGTVTSNPYTNGANTHFNIRTDMIDGEEKHVNISITTSNTLPIEIYDFVDGRATLSAQYESGYGYASYYGARNIFLGAYINPYFQSNYSVTHNDNKPFYAVFNDMRSYIARTFRKYLSSDEASLCIAIITGDKNYLSDDVYSAFKNLGVSHMLVVSGLHLSIAANILYLISELNFKNRFLSALLQIVGILSFGALTGFGFSVRRAIIMNLILILGRFFNMKADALNSLGLAAFLMCLNPLNAGDIGLLWSFSCTLSIILAANRLSEFTVGKLNLKNKISIKLVTALSAPIAALIGSIPFMVFVTGTFSPYTILVNLLTVPFTGIIILFGGLAVLTFALHINSLAYLLMLVTGLTAKYLNFVTGEFYKMPYSVVKTNQNFVYIWLAVTAAVIVLIFILDLKKVFLRLAVIASAAVLVGLVCIDTLLNSDKITLSVLDVGNGITVTAKNQGNLVVFNSYGEKYQYYTIKNELSEFENIACLIDIPPDKPDFNYCRSIMKDFSAEKIIVHSSDFYDEKYAYIRYIGTDVDCVSDNYTLYMFDGAMLNIVSTEGCTWEYLTIYDTEILICPMNAVFGELPESFRNPDIVILNSLTDDFAPEGNAYFVVSAYGEECSDTLNFLSENGFNAEATDGLGRIDFTFYKNGSVSEKRIYTGGVTRYAEN